METLSTLSLEAEKILQIIKDSYQKLDIVVEKYNFVVQNNINLLEEINFLKSEITILNDQNIKTETQKELLLKEYQESEDKNNSVLKALKDCEERIHELEKDNFDLKDELKLKSDELEKTQYKYNIKTANLVNIIQEKELSENIDKNKSKNEINELLAKIAEMEKTILELNEKKSYIESFNNNNELLKSDIKLKIDQTIEKINSLIS